MKTLSEKIDHIVVLMLENRSFDSMLGKLYPAGEKFDGLTGTESNPLQGKGDIPVWSNTSLDSASMSVPSPDPGEHWTDINEQLYGQGKQPGSGPPPMNGFVNNYVSQSDAAASSYSPKAVMHYYDPSQVPVLSQLARQFAVCDQWFASAPCQTWPNRFFVHTGTAGGYENNMPVHFPYRMPTIFNRLEKAGRSWSIYFHDVPLSMTLSSLWPHIDHFFDFDDFARDAASGQLPAYSFIEPRFFPELQLPNDQHAPHHVGLGEELIASVYNAVRASPNWSKTLLIIVYDEHGGNFDHVAPPAAVPPDGSSTQPFAFDRYGVRVPAVLISPYIQPGTVLRASTTALPHNGPPYPFDHTSIIATVRTCFNLGPALTRRDAVAPDLQAVLTLEEPDNDGPQSVSALPYSVSPDELQAALTAPLNDVQTALHAAAAHLPVIGAENKLEALLSTVENHIENLLQGVLPIVPDHKNSAEALPFIKARLRDFWGSGYVVTPDAATPPPATQTPVKPDGDWRSTDDTQENKGSIPPTP